jgi:hemerythrin-like domain-containing protein
MKATKQAMEGEHPVGSDEAGLRMRMRGEERRITSQHEKLDVFCREVYTRIDKDGAQLAINDFLLFSAALDAHMTVEEDIYFPALHGLRPDIGDELAGLVAEHDELRVGLDEVRRALKRDDGPQARVALDQLARRVSAHEIAEEDLIALINEAPALEEGRSAL